MRYVFGVISLVVLVLAVIIIVVSRDPAGDRVEDADKQLNVTQYVNTDTRAVFTEEGEIKGDTEHDTVRITVSRNSRQIEHVRGFTNRVLSSETYPNTQSGFDHFMHALQNAGFSAEQEPRYDSHKGACPFGSRYLFELLDGSQRVMRLWATSCRDEDGNFAGEEGQVRRLFQNQIPDYREFAKDLDL